MATPRVRVRHVLLFLLVWVAIAVVFVVVRAPFVARQRLECVRYVIWVVNQHVVDSQGEWPEKWAELEAVRMPKDVPPRPCPWPEIRSNVRIDFKADPAALSVQSAAEFEAIRPVGRCGEYAEDVEKLLETLQSLCQPKPTDKPQEEPAKKPATAP
jgi:hypothetical protein